MSAVVGKIILTVGLAVAGVVLYTFFNRRQANTHENTRRGGGPNPDDYRAAGPNWENDPDDEDLVRKRRRRKSGGRSQREASPTSVSSSAFSNSSSSTGGPLQNGCPICLESFRSLRANGITLCCTPCGHLFCELCLAETLERSPFCPTCRHQTTFAQCHPVYL